MEVSRLKLTNKLRTLLFLSYFVFFSLPLVFIWYQPMWRVGTYYSRFDLLAVFLRVLAVMFSPWAFLAGAIVSYKRSLKLQTYCATGLFIWAALLQMWIVIFALLYQPIYYRPFA